MRILKVSTRFFSLISSSPPWLRVVLKVLKEEVEYGLLLAIDEGVGVGKFGFLSSSTITGWGWAGSWPTFTFSGVEGSFSWPVDWYSRFLGILSHGLSDEGLNCWSSSILSDRLTLVSSTTFFGWSTIVPQTILSIVVGWTDGKMVTGVNQWILEVTLVEGGIPGFGCHDESLTERGYSY